MEFERDPNKSARNLAKHGVSFEEAATVFSDPMSMTAADPDHSMQEDRLIIVGMSAQYRLLIVAFAERGQRIRIISGRELSRAEREQYEAGNH